MLRPHSTKNVKHRGGGFSREFRAALREQWGSIVTEGQCEIHRKDTEAIVTSASHLHVIFDLLAQSLSEC